MKYFSIRLFLLMFLFIGTHIKLVSQDIEKIIWTCNWSNDDKLIVAGGADQVLRIYNGKTFELIRNDTLNEWIHRLRWHPSKNILAVAANGNGSRLINFEDGYQIKLDGLNNAGTRAIDWNSDGSELAIADYEGIIHLFDEEGSQTHSFSKENTKSYTAIDWHPANKSLIVTGEFVREYKPDGTFVKKFLHSPYRVLLLCAEWHPSGEFYALGDYGIPDGNIPPSIQFYNQDHELIQKHGGSLAEYRNMSWSPDGSKLATSGDALRIWSKDGKILFESAPEDDNLWGVDWNSDGTKIVTSSEKGKIRVWDDKAKLIKTLK